MPYDLDDLPIVESMGRLGRRPSVDSPTHEAYQMRRSLLRGPQPTISLNVGMQVARFLQDRLFPSAAEVARFTAAGAGPDYTFYSDCAGYDYNATCEHPCFGFPPGQMSSWYCATCDEQHADPAHNPAWNWHFVGQRGTIRYIDREPDVCNGKDAWKWQIKGACGNCGSYSTYRCHDGYKKYDNASAWEPTICQGLISCNGQLTVC